jgi:hypothetical protein
MTPVHSGRDNRRMDDRAASQVPHDPGGLRLTEHDARGALDTLLAAHKVDAGRLPAPAQSRYSREQIVAAIQRWIESYGAPPTVFDWDPSWARRRGQAWRAERFELGDWPTISIVRRQFGNMSKALYAAGARPRQGPVRARAHLLSDEDVLDAIREWARRYGEPPATSDWSPARARSAGQQWRAERYLAGDWPSVSTVIRRFGTFGAAVRAAGLEPRPRGRHTKARGSFENAVTAALCEQLADGNPRCGPTVLAARVRGVARARHADDPDALHGALVDLAAAALSWADSVNRRLVGNHRIAA